ncbi:unnamed protein product [Chilo suppressalis]|uniref:Phospholipid scramblase n=1 Tax=Chilo suppressalis TaxID=168631 RepID=A0ABN8L6R0_CHISP|nr:unnamed protein product [Chilo suppressalis]
MGDEQKTPCYGDLNEELQMIQQQNLAPNVNKLSTTIGQVPSFIQSKVGIQLQIAELQRQQLILDKLHADEVFKAKESALEAQKNLALTMLDANPSSTFLIETNNKVLNNVAEFSAINVFANASAPPAIEVDPVVSPSETAATAATEDIKATDLGLSQLSSLEGVKIQHVSAPNARETYEVFGPNGSRIYRVNISFGFFADKKKRTVLGEILNNKLKEVATFRTNENNAMELVVGNKIVCVVKRQPTMFKPVLTVSDELGKILLKIKGLRSWINLGTNSPFFYVETSSKDCIGCIIKDLSRTCKSSDASIESQYSAIDFPCDLDVNSKLAVIASSFLIVSANLAADRKSVDCV